MISLAHQKSIIKNLGIIQKSPFQFYVSSEKDSNSTAGFILSYLTKILGLKGIYIDSSLFGNDIITIIMEYKLNIDQLILIYSDVTKKRFQNTLLLEKRGSLIELSLIINELLIKREYDFIFLNRVQDIMANNDSGQVISFIQYLSDKISSKKMFFLALSVDGDSSSVLLPKLINQFHIAQLLLG